MLSRASFLVRNGYDVLDIDLRCHRESGGRFITSGYLEARDIVSAVRWLRQRCASCPIAVLGHSYGAVAALRAGCGSPDIAAVISDSAFTSDEEVLANVTRYYLKSNGTPLWAKGMLLLSRCPGIYAATVVAFRLRTGKYMAAGMTTVMPSVALLHKPVLFVSGERDFIAPTANARRMFAATPSTHKELFTVPNAGHNTTYKIAPKDYERAVVTFLERATGS
jgi:pimeloyl-ACP methyl ester carboxylesterase